MIEWIVLRKIIAGLVLPPTGPLLCAMIGLALMRRKPRLGRALAWAGVGSLFAVSLPVVAIALVNLAGGGEPLDLSRPSSAQAIVITGGGVRDHAAEYGGYTLAQLTLERTRYGAHLARQTGLPVLVTGGVLSKRPSEAGLMSSALQQEFGIQARWMETKSRNTHENAQYTAAMLLPQGITRILLVTHAFDVRRARLEFEAAGFQVTPAPTGIRPRTPVAMAVTDFLPSVSALQSSYYAGYELLGLLVRRVTQR
jgi:uncharacterized SAM-binding protein YcdF (DUF218 family)